MDTIEASARPMLTPPQLPSPLPNQRPEPWLRGPRLALREFWGEDLMDLVAMHREPRLRAWLLDDAALDQGLVAWRFLHNIQAVYRQHEGLGIWHASTPQADQDGAGLTPCFIGWFNLMPLPARGPEAVELGSRLLPSAWGGALALEGGELLLRHAFEGLGLARVWATCHPANRSARACLAALGFAEQGLDAYEGQTAVYAQLERSCWHEGLALSPRARRARGLRAHREGRA